jgi:hypothetical protein
MFTAYLLIKLDIRNPQFPIAVRADIYSQSNLAMTVNFDTEAYAEFYKVESTVSFSDARKAVLAFLWADGSGVLEWLTGLLDDQTQTEVWLYGNKQIELRKSNDLPYDKNIPDDDVDVLVGF